MSWARYDDELSMNLKIGKLRAKGVDGIAALGLHLLANTYCRHNGTKGRVEPHVPELLVGRIGKKLAGLLVEVGMFNTVADLGWEINDYSEFHDPNDPEPDKSASQRKKELSDKRASAGRAGGLAKASNATSKRVAVNWQKSSPVPVPVPTLIKSSVSLSSRGSNEDDDDDFMKAITLCVENKAHEKRPRDRRAWEITVVPNTISELGAVIHAALEAGDTPLEAAGAALGSQRKAEMAAGRITGRIK